MSPETFRLILAICAVGITLAVMGAMVPNATSILMIFLFFAAILWLGYRAIRWAWRKWG